MSNAMTGPGSATATLMWSATLGLTAAVGSYGLACVFPFAAIAALAALTLPTRQAMALIAAVWGVNQFVGFTLLSFPHDTQAYVWGAFIGAAAFAALAAAKLVLGNGAKLISVRSLAVIAIAIVAYQAVMFVGAFALDGFESSTPEIVARIAANDLVWFAGLAALRLALVGVMPRLFGSVPTLRTA